MTTIAQEIRAIIGKVSALMDDCRARHEIPAGIGEHYGRAANYLGRAIEDMKYAARETEE